MEKLDPPTFDWTPPKERRSNLIALALGISGVLLFGMCGVGLWIVDGGPSTDPRPTPTKSTLLAAAPTQPPPDDHLVETLGNAGPQLGTRIRHGALEYRVVDQRCGVPEVRTNAGPAGQPTRGHFCVVTLDVRNLSRSALVFTAADQIAYTTAGGRYLGSAEASRHANGAERTFLTPIGPGARVTGVIAFDTPKGSRLDSVRLRSAAAAGSVAVSLT
ncbi:DUF4352 domain-containing protein [Cryptosporangium sp. NPDC048952]|uniref:DUF4352 domain-containing protein n=1 Tax=Cryptosporangium sp. NPDC048952 TaxID=3363961 RepID=UPI003723EA7C